MLHFEVTGEGSPVVLLHAGIVDSRIWQKTLPLLAASRTVVTYDQRGYGRSPQPASAYSLADDLAWVLDSAGIERAALVGLSRGGRIALDFALTYPGRVSALVLVASGLPGHPIHLDISDELERRWETAEARGDVQTLADIDLQIWAPLGSDPELRAMTVENAAWSSSPDPGTDTEPPAAERLGEIAAPTLVVTGARDVPQMDEIARLLEHGIPGARRAEIAEADHVVPWRTPEEFAGLVTTFLREAGA